jgi:hypothetical protein
VTDAAEAIDAPIGAGWTFNEPLTPRSSAVKTTEFRPLRHRERNGNNRDICLFIVTSVDLGSHLTILNPGKDKGCGASPPDQPWLPSS